MITAAVVSSRLAPRMRPVGRSAVSPASPLICGMTATPVSKPESPSASRGENEQGDPQHRDRIPVLRGQRRPPVGHDDRGGREPVRSPPRDDHDVEGEIDADEHDRDSDRLAEAPQEHPPREARAGSSVNQSCPPCSQAGA